MTQQNPSPTSAPDSVPEATAALRQAMVAPKARDLTGDEQVLFDRLAKEHAWRLEVPVSAPLRTRTVPNPDSADNEGPVYAAITTMLATIVACFGADAWSSGHPAAGAILGLTGFAVLVATVRAVRRDTLRARAEGTGARLMVPETVANAYTTLQATTTAVTQIQAPHAVTEYMDAASAHMDRLVALAHRLHQRGFSTAAVGAAVREEMVGIASEATALLDVLLGNPSDRAEAIAWEQTHAALGRHPSVESEDEAVAAAFDAYQQTLKAKQN